MIVDVFMFDDEFDMLDCRLYELRSIVDLFVAIEADQSVSGIEKPYHLTERLNRYPDVPLEVVRVPLGDVRGNDILNDTWARDAVQRNAAMPLLRDLPGDTLVITGDLDEIPRRDMISAFGGIPLVLQADHLVYSLKWRHARLPIWEGTTLIRRQDMPSIWDVRFSAMRPDIRRAPRGGWHLSYFGTPADRERKMRHYAHQELLHLADKVGEILPLNHLHVDGSDLVMYEGGWPSWAADGLAPAHWYKDWLEAS
jgi:hypothetical protein